MKSILTIESDKKFPLINNTIDFVFISFGRKNDVFNVLEFVSKFEYFLL